MVDLVIEKYFSVSVKTFKFDKFLRGMMILLLNPF